MDSEALAREVCELLTSRLPAPPNAIVLTGSFARNEGSVLMEGNRVRVLGDMEYMVVFPAGVDRGPLQVALDKNAREIREELASRGIECDLEFRAVTAEYFYSLGPQVFGYELLKHGRTVWGDASILAAVPRLSKESIPRWDAWRMLNNRIIEQLEWSGQIAEYDRDQLGRLYYQLIKCHVDLVTTLLVFAGRYEDTYQARATAFSKWAFESQCKPGMSFLHFLAQRVAACTAFKLDPNSAAPPLGVHIHGREEEALRADLRQALTDFVPLVHEIWRWEAAEFSGTGSDSEASDEALQNAVLAAQPLKEKVRGWAKLVLMPGVRRQKGFARRIAALGLRGSPRYLVYAVAARLYFELPAILANEVSTETVNSLEQLLPVIFDKIQSERRVWWRLRANVIASWHAFLRTHFA